MSKSESLRLRAISEAEQLEHQARQLRNTLSNYDPFVPEEKVTAAWIRGLIAGRRRRDELLGRDFFGEPVWDMLLELYALHLSQEVATITELGRSTDVPATTALRCAVELERANLISRTKHQSDGRKLEVSLTKSAVKKLDELFRGGTLIPF